LNTVVEPEKKAEIFLYHLSLLGCKPHQEVRAAFLKTIFGKLPVIAHRDLSELAQAVTFCYEEDKSSDSRIIKREHIKKAFEELQTIYPDFKYDIQEETDEEMRDRHHKESLTQQELHFVQQQKIQIAMQKTANCSDRGGVFERGIKEAEASLTDKQNQLYEDSVRSGRGQRAYKSYMNSSWWSSFF
jgi:tRNA(Ile)-lysidine synthase TilS/MesJ